jgi:hypothetical protein
VGLPGSAGEIARNASRSDAVVRTHVPGRPHQTSARHATGERTRGARNLYDPAGHLHGASGGGRTWSGFCPKHSAPGAVELARRIRARRGGGSPDPAVSDGGSVTPGPVAAFSHDGIDLPNIAFGAHTTLAYAANATGTGGTLTASDGRHAASIALFGSYIAGSFVIAADGHGGTLVREAPQADRQVILAHSDPPHA